MLRLTQQELANKADVSPDILSRLERPGRKHPDITVLSKIRVAFERAGLIFIDADKDAGEGVRWSKPSGKLWVDCLRHGRAMLGDSLNELAEKSGISRDTINRLENGNLRRIPEQSARRLRETLFESGVDVVDEGKRRGAGVRLRLGLAQDHLGAATEGDTRPKKLALNGNAQRTRGKASKLP